MGQLRPALPNWEAVKVPELNFLLSLSYGLLIPGRHNVRRQSRQIRTKPRPVRNARLSPGSVGPLTVKMSNVRVCALSLHFQRKWSNSHLSHLRVIFFWFPQGEFSFPGGGEKFWNVWNRVILTRLREEMRGDAGDQQVNHRERTHLFSHARHVFLRGRFDR